MENANNIRFVHPNCASRSMGLRVATDDLVGRHVKKGFRGEKPDGGWTVEHMWIKVQSRHGNTLFGYLDSDPVMNCGVRYEGSVQLDIEEVEDILPPLTQH